MSKLICRYFGFDCNFTICDEYDVVVNNFIKHAQFNHGIEYSKRFFSDMLFKNKIQNIHSRKNKNELVSYNENYDEFRLEKWKIGSRNFS